MTDQCEVLNAGAVYEKGLIPLLFCPVNIGIGGTIDDYMGRSFFCKLI